MDRIKVERAIAGLTEWQKHVQTNSDIDRDISTAIEALKAQLSQQATTSDLIDKQQALDIFDDYNVSVENGELEAYSRDRKRLCELPTAQPEPTDINAKEAVYNLAEKIGIHQLFALTVELRGEPIQPEPAIPLSWIEKYIEWLKSFDNEFANLEGAHISVMVKKWRDEQDETD